LPESTGLSPQNVELALSECLETSPSDAELRELCACTPLAPSAHVLLAGNVFVAAHRAIAIALAAAERVCVRSSRREQHMARLLQLAGAPFELVDELRPAPGDHIWAYGSDATLAALRTAFDPGVVFHGHGSGFGVALVGTSEREALPEAADALARDVVPFDQRGCLSPRVAIVLGGAELTRDFGRLLAASLTEWERRVPRGRLSSGEMATEVRYRDALAYAIEVLPAGSGIVSVDADAQLSSIVPPAGRNVHVLGASDVRAVLTGWAPHIAALGVHGAESSAPELLECVPGARISRLGRMQRPPFDGPVDQRRTGA
jgi:hypothetical protein